MGGGGNGGNGGRGRRDGPDTGGFAYGNAHNAENRVGGRDDSPMANAVRGPYNATIGRLTGVRFDDAPRATHDPLNQGSRAGGEGADRRTIAGGGLPPGYIAGRSASPEANRLTAERFTRQTGETIPDHYLNYGLAHEYLNQRDINQRIAALNQPKEPKQPETPTETPTTPTPTPVPTPPSAPSFAGFGPSPFQRLPGGPAPVFAYDPDRVSPGGPLTEAAELPEQAQKVREKIRQEAQNIVDQTTRNRRGRVGLQDFDEDEFHTLGNIAGYGTGRRTLLGG